MRSAIHFGAILVAVLTLVLMMTGTAGATMIANPPSFDFGDVALNTTKSATISVTTDPGWLYSGYSFSPTGSGFDVSSTTCVAGTGGTCNLDVTFTPTTTGSVASKFIVNQISTTGVTSGITIGVKGNGISLTSGSPSSIDFGDVPLNTTVYKDILITLDAGYAIAGYSYSGTGFNFGTCDGDDPAICTFRATFTPKAVGSATGTMTAFVNSTTNPNDHRNVIIPLAGNGVDYNPPTSAASATSNGNPYSFGTWTNADVTVTLSASDSGSGVASTQYSLDGGAAWTTYSAPFTVSTADSTDTNLQYRSTDKAGNVEGIQTATVKIDKVSPKGSISINGGAGYTESANVTLTLTGEDNGGGSGVSQMHLSNDNATWSAWEAFASSKQWTVSSGDGAKTVYVQFQDAAGNVGPSYHDSITVDSAPPTTTASATSAGNPYTLGTWTNADVTVTLSAKDNSGGSGVIKTEYSLDGGATWTTYSAPFTASTEGTTNLQYRSTDKAGNIEGIQTGAIEIDKTAPKGSLAISGGALYTNSTSVMLNPSGNDNGDGSGVAKMRFSNDNVAWSSWETYATSRSSWTIASGDGVKTVYVQFQDGAGNVGPSYSDSITLDATKPTISAAVSNGTKGSNGWYTGNVTVHFTCDDTGGSGIPSGNCPVDQTLSTEGASVSSTAQTVTDAAGNVSAASSMITVKIDKTAPTVAITDPKATDAVQDHYTFAAPLSDSLSGPDSLNFSVRSDDGSTSGSSVGFDKLSATKGTVSGGQATFSLQFDTTKLPDGYYLLVAQGYDSAGNLASTTLHFKIVNLAVVKLLPSTDSNNAGRTMPVKFSVRESSTNKFVENQELTIKIYQKGSTSTLQSSTYGTKATDYRIDKTAELYIANFQTLKTPTTYVVEVWRKTATSPLQIGSFEFQTVK